MPKPALLTNDPNPGKAFARQDRDLESHGFRVGVAAGTAHRKYRGFCALSTGREPRSYRTQATSSIVEDRALAESRDRYSRQSVSQEVRRSISGSGSIMTTGFGPGKEFFSIANYVEHNVEAGLAASPETWPRWSSAGERRRSRAPKNENCWVERREEIAS
jgi:hypothetical protein